MTEDEKVPTWQRLIALAAALALVATVVIWHRRIAPDFWPPDSSRVGPNIVASVLTWAVVVTVAALVWPPTRRRIHRFVSGHLAPLHENHADLLASHVELHRRLDELHEHVLDLHRHHGVKTTTKGDLP